ncbi:hypothetical protein DMC01_03860 [Campylobacter troglodytis]|nr:hypothetical protein DMC01_03860 [Campylobacter troglodytis]
MFQSKVFQKMHLVSLTKFIKKKESFLLNLQLKAHLSTFFQKNNLMSLQTKTNTFQKAVL